MKMNGSENLINEMFKNVSYNPTEVKIISNASVTSHSHCDNFMNQTKFLNYTKLERNNTYKNLK
jgi:hypothetical protein